ncbi:aminotransferase family protein [Metabacillus niabensis]|uniref:Adenosylmethionine-8-amino-7-oxononanoate aminotransferase n=1 Tax=Metabacillus niabensis TaxID=324854 RepID=A0ABT9YWZ3_9BACI|nr:aspartate aminotransferase family protein [Metabacillus niabensis]MDQ0223833.1 adenosylmethionine-8-amino-7-oxononanoate aminotransferase [Metabacillus niabensis]
MLNKMDDIHQLEQLDKQHFLHPTSSIEQQQTLGPAFIFREGKGIYLSDVKGNVVIDGMSSLWNVNIGHGRLEIGEAAREQMAKLAYSSCFATFSNEPAIRLAAKLAKIAPGQLSAVFYTSGGSEANDTAYKLARHYWSIKGMPEKKKIISRTKSYHGVSVGATSATGLQPFREFSGSLAPDFLHVDQFDTDELRQLIIREGAESIAAFLAEPVQGAGGVHIPPENYFAEVRKICDEFNLLLITDEVITGFGRTGKWFGIEHYGVTPDMMCIAKGITSGYAQLGGVMISKEINETFKQRSGGTFLHGFTYSGHATACAIALKNLEIIEREQLVSNAKVRGDELLAGLKQLKNESEIIENVRALGLMAAIEFKENKTTTPFSPQVVAEAAKRGLICRAVTFNGQDTVVIAPPLIIKKAEVEKVIQILRETINA